MKKSFVLILLLFCAYISNAQKLPLLKVSDNKKYLITQNNQPFFWLGGTAWELIHRLDSQEVDIYLTNRAKKGFTVIQTVILAELDGLNSPNAYGHKPLVNNDPTRLNEKYFEHVDYVMKKTESLGLYIALLPTWGDKFNKRWGAGPEVFNEQNAEVYGKILAKRYLTSNNIIWVLGGDRLPEKDEHYAVIRAIAKGIRKADSLHLITYHPAGGKKASDFFNENWLDIDMFQSGHSRTAQEYKYVLDSRKSNPPRPVINGEARYENIPDRFWEKQKNGWLDDADVRVSAYWSMIAGAAGYTYGCNDIWQMYETGRKPVINARTDWQAALDLPGSGQMKHMKEIFEKLPWQSMNYDQSLILNENPENESYIISAMGKEKNFAVAYTPTGKPIKFDLTKLKSSKLNAYWFNPRSGKVTKIGEFENTKPQDFKPWASGWGSDFLLIIVNSNTIFDTRSGTN